jgi:hypothetical protein
MKRWLSHLTIVAYLAALAAGIGAHTVSFGAGAHTAMYFVVWDMFCGWASYEYRTHLIGEGESGRYYQLAPGPWGEFLPFGDIDRRHYDALLNAAHRIAQNTLKHTRHEPMARIFVVEECWPKKFNLPDDLWAQYYNEPKDVQKYYRVRITADGNGMLLATKSSWYNKTFAQCLGDNPRLRNDTRRGKPFYAVTPRSPWSDRASADSLVPYVEPTAVESPLAE